MRLTRPFTLRTTHLFSFSLHTVYPTSWIQSQLRTEDVNAPEPVSMPFPLPELLFLAPPPHSLTSIPQVFLPRGQWGELLVNTPTLHTRTEAQTLEFEGRARTPASVLLTAALGTKTLHLVCKESAAPAHTSLPDVSHGREGRLEAF